MFSEFQLFRARFGAATIAACAVLAAGLASPGFALAEGSGGLGPAGQDRQEVADSGDTKYVRMWDQTSRRDKRWARSTAECESGGDPNAVGGGGIYRGAFQFMKSTWKSAPESPGGDPIDYSYRTQAVVAVALKHQDGAGHWPVCG